MPHPQPANQFVPALPANLGAQAFHNDFHLTTREHPLLGPLPFARKVIIVRNDAEAHYNDHDISLLPTNGIAAHVHESIYRETNAPLSLQEIARHCRTLRPTEVVGRPGSTLARALVQHVNRVRRVESDPQCFVPELDQRRGERLMETLLPLFSVHEVARVEEPALGPMRASCVSRPRTVVGINGNRWTQGDVKGCPGYQCRLVVEGGKDLIVEVYRGENARKEIIEDYEVGMEMDVGRYLEKRARKMRLIGVAKVLVEWALPGGEGEVRVEDVLGAGQGGFAEGAESSVDSGYDGLSDSEGVEVNGVGASLVGRSQKREREDDEDVSGQPKAKRLRC